MSQFRDLIARMAVDPEFARHARANPEAVAAQYGLTPDETEQLRGLADASAGAGPTALGARLSKSGIGTGGLAGLLETPHFEPPDPGLDVIHLPPGVIVDPVHPDPPIHPLFPIGPIDLHPIDIHPLDPPTDGGDPEPLPPPLTHDDGDSGDHGSSHGSDHGSDHGSHGSSHSTDAPPPPPLPDPEPESAVEVGPLQTGEATGADPAAVQPVAAEQADGGIGTTGLLIGGAGLAAGVVAGGIAGAVAGRAGKKSDDEGTAAA
ncbi:hypothetical protein QEZ54_03925 [Catellatospora sp. KI3]|uniref:hypothetical protein n=1 Tax=Catellatospora sp. KI3 TaxID=3041620 RepID=UPI0024825FAC|nr:hypothetical protein [Catellatospora sp. KI3]MDI1460108.1 hypothetical protein [Catellatospora sp. KI3]